MTARILVAEDDRGQADLMRRYLERDGYRVTVVHDGREAVEVVRRQSPDLLVLDLALTVLPGLDVCRAVRVGHDLPIVMVSACASEQDQLLGFSLGADDYVAKPFSPPVLLARLRAVLRRATTGRLGRRHVGGLVIDTDRHEVSVDDAPVAATRAEFALLACLSSAPGRVFTRQLLLERMGRIDRAVTARSIDMHVLNLRRKIEQNHARPRYLLTVTGVGYKLADLPDEDARSRPAGVA
ncbi:response regulator transcription factor [Jiangella sp. DSM 45060]|uniref:response regulator transcription factor n=1 Tax=Jiangella sp. DSM 45060 TaxID=1798224 RepID=UPI00087B39E5|nr:response regulator transcription factor [Jiangella sp. DSM 45060]SDT47024.1 DNA-binding response regulator, OmpR family, contains REC and winged-helix (wHTH) domain [Jiangella sp. DSM 45060]